MIIYIVVFLLVVIAAFCNAITDILRNNFTESVFKNLNAQYWNAAISWTNKWVDGDKTKGRTFWKVWGIKITKPVVFTDAWHLFKTITLLSLATAFGLLTPYCLGLPAFAICWYLGFENFYSKILRSK